MMGNLFNSFVCNEMKTISCGNNDYDLYKYCNLDGHDSKK